MGNQFWTILENTMQSETEIFICIILVTAKVFGLEIIERGKKYSEDPNNQYRLYLSSKGSPISAWHDVPLYSDRTNQTYNMIVEIPRFSQAKFEISRELTLNPIIQDKVGPHNRFLDNIFPWYGHICNYGHFPQTWENPFFRDPLTGLYGDKDPLDVLGILGMQDGSETDWKVIVMNIEEANRNKIENMDDLDKVHPGLSATIRNYFKIYKVPSGKPETIFAFDGVFQNVEFSKNVISHNHEMWREMIANCSITGDDVGSFNTANTLQQTQCSITEEEAVKEVQSQAPYDPQPDALPDSVDKWSFVNSGTLDLKDVSKMMGTILSAFVLIIINGF